MRTLKYLSHSAKQLFDFSPERFYLERLADVRPPERDKGLAAHVGTAFDFFVKESLGCTDMERPIEFLQEGRQVFDAYRITGALEEIQRQRDLSTSSEYEQRLFAIRRGVPLVGYPDAVFHYDDFVLICDWKVKGYASRGTSPRPGYLALRDELSYQVKRHKKCDAICRHGLWIDATPFDVSNPKWAAQLATYAILLNVAFNKPCIFQIEELVFNRRGELRVATHRGQVDQDYFHGLLNGYNSMWIAVRDGIFDAPTRAHLEKVAAAIAETSPQELEMSTPKYGGW